MEFWNALRRYVLGGTALVLAAAWPGPGSATPIPGPEDDGKETPVLVDNSGGLEGIVEQEEIPTERYRVARADISPALVMPFVAGAGYSIFTIDGSDPKARTLWDIVINNCNTDAVRRFYGVRRGGDIRPALRKLAKYNDISNPSRISNGRKIKIPNVLLRKDQPAPSRRKRSRSMRRSRQEQTRPSRRSRTRTRPGRVSSSRGWRSPFGGHKKPQRHRCMIYKRLDPHAGSRRICPFELYGAGRSHGRHRGLDLWAPIGTRLYAMKPGVVIGAGKRYVNRIGQIPRKFRHAKSNGIAVMIDSQDGFKYLYVHMQRVYVRIGDRVGHNTLVGRVGCTGSAYCGNPHAHVHVYRAGTRKTVDPLRYMRFLK
jgi:murein DD-endopeptidase MepM/ murein hydrolase activator NlpD